MVTICCALYPEARELIRMLQLKKEGENRRFPLFSDGEGKLRLAVTGVGAVAAATAVAELSVCDPPGKPDILVNFGSCASAGRKPGTVCLCNKLTDSAAGKSYYPDILLRHPFEEEELVTVARVVTGKELEGACAGNAEDRRRPASCLYDMEGAAVYQAGNYYYGPHQMFFLKVVTDHGADGSRQLFQKHMDEAAQAVISFLRQLALAEDGNAERECVLRRAAKEDAERLGDLLHCTAAMRMELEQLLYYRRLSGCDYESWMRDGRLPAKDKREGKKLFEEFKVQSYLCGK